MKWQPIETAPKDGTRVLLYRSGEFDSRIVCGEWNDDLHAKNPRPYWAHDLQRLWGLLEARQNPPTHWMPLPNPPKG